MVLGAALDKRNMLHSAAVVCFHLNSLTTFMWVTFIYVGFFKQDLLVMEYFYIAVMVKDLLLTASFSVLISSH